ncbi:hypothetical protein FTUN_1981 [Frigoriglobus tundricola]|uniref:DUF1559 domain-containing protein n=2 Tax=Frigoriglobus tundricola TaxID=2774151 RepID=A0A6M5YMJ4_9BACT|nr:hypothetical protein FTUN_1981 [Frigoriglobus tundricola]
MSQASGVWIGMVVSPTNGLTGWYNANGGNAMNAGRSNYIGCGGSFGALPPDDGFSGTSLGLPPMPGVYSANKHVKITDIADGTSNTIAFGETIGDSDVGSRNYALTWMGAGSLPLCYGLPTGSTSGWANFTSFHTGQVLFSFADGSVRGIRKGVGAGASANPSTFTSDWYVLQYAGGISDGQVIDFSVLGQ